MGAKGAPVSDPDNSGLDPLDRDRAASLADEGGAAGAVVESRETPQTQEGNEEEGNEESQQSREERQESREENQASQKRPGSLESQKKSLGRPRNRNSLERSGANPIAAVLTVAVGMLTGIVVWRLVRRER
jgi:hypothetical protein